MRNRGWTSVRFGVDTEEEPSRVAVADDDRPMRVLIAGDFSGHREQQEEGWSRSERPFLIDPDEVDDVLASLKPSVRIPLGGPERAGITIEFRSFDDFHPDSLYQKLPLFQALISARKRLASSPWKPSAEHVEPPKPAAPPPPAEPLPPGASLLDSILGQQSPSQPAPENGSSNFKTLSDREWSRMIDRIVAPHVSPAQDPRQLQAIKAVDAEIQQRMRYILHDPNFQRLEAAWRSLDFLLRRVETGPELSLYGLDLSYDHLQKDLAGAEDPESSKLYRLLVEKALKTPGGRPWTLVIGLYEVDPNPAEIQVLSRMAEVCSLAGAPFVAAAKPLLVGVQSFVEQPDPRLWKDKLDAASTAVWTEFRRSPVSQWAGLVTPRMLLRMPYGKHLSSLDLFEFEEMGERPSHAEYLWGNGAIACACVVATRQNGISGLPVHTWRDDGEATMTPCAEFWMTERASERIIQAGVMPLASVKNSDGIRLIRLQSLNLEDPALPVARSE